MKISKLCEEIRQWGKIRGINSNTDPQIQLQRMMQEVLELFVYEADNNDTLEGIDAVGDTVVTMVNLCNCYDIKLEDLLTVTCEYTFVDMCELYNVLTNIHLHVTENNITLLQMYMVDMFSLLSKYSLENFELDIDECVKSAFDVIRLRKGLLTDSGSFIRYGKLSQEEKNICDEKQGNPNEEYFLEDFLIVAEPKDFKA